MENYNQLSPAQVERLAILSEECGEVQQVIGKILRHGYQSYNPVLENSESNRIALEHELGDLMHAIERMTWADDIWQSTVDRFRQEKAIKISQWLHHN